MANVLQFPKKTDDAPTSPPDLKMGARGEAVAEVQTLLSTWGFSPGTADGIYGGSTVEAVQALQRKLKVPPTGAFDAATRAAARSDFYSAASAIKTHQRAFGLTGVSATPSVTLKKGDKGDAVKALQKLLVAAGYALPKYGVDGDFGVETEAAVIASNGDLTERPDADWDPRWADAVLVAALEKRAVEISPPPKVASALPWILGGLAVVAAGAGVWWYSSRRREGRRADHAFAELGARYALPAGDPDPTSERAPRRRRTKTEKATKRTRKVSNSSAARTQRSKFKDCAAECRGSESANDRRSCMSACLRAA